MPPEREEKDKNELCKSIKDGTYAKYINKNETAHIAK